MKPAAGLVLAQRYELVAPLEDRGLGESWRCADRQQGGRVVALKFLNPVAGDALPAELTEYFKSLRAFRNDHVPAALNQGLWEKRPFLVFEHFEGRSLGAALDETRGLGLLLPLPALKTVFDTLCEVLDAAHTAPRQVLHLGLTPGSVLVAGEIDAPTVSLVDFGIARHAGPDPLAPTRSARVLSFPSPEQLSNGRVGPWTDVFALGALLLEALSDPPQPGLTMAPTSLDRRRDDVPGGLWEVASRAMAANPDDRFASVAAMRTALTAAWDTPVPPVRAPTPAPPPPPPDDDLSTTETPISTADRLAAKAALEGRMAPKPAPPPPAGAFVSAPMPSPTAPGLAPLPSAAFVAPPRAPAAAFSLTDGPTFTEGYNPGIRAAGLTDRPSVPEVGGRTMALDTNAILGGDRPSAAPDEIETTRAIETVGPAVPSFPTDDDDELLQTMAVPKPHEREAREPGTGTMVASSHFQPSGDEIESTQDMGNAEELLRTMSIDEKLQAQIAASSASAAAPRARVATQAAPLAQRGGLVVGPPVRAPEVKPAPAPEVKPAPAPEGKPAADAKPADPAQTTRYRLIVAIGILFIPVLLGLYVVLRKH